MMACRKRSTASSIFEVLSLNPLPYPVLFILALIFLFLGFQWYSSYESAVEATEVGMNLVLLAIPLLILFAVRWLSTVENPEGLFPMSGRRRRTYNQPSEGSSPWGVAAVIVLLLVMVQFQSFFLDSWFV